LEPESLKELIDFLNGVNFVSPSDVTMILSLYQRLPISRAKLEAHADDHMGIEGDLSYLSAKYGALHRKAEGLLNAHAGTLVKSHRQREQPQWAAKGAIECDEKYLQLHNDCVDKFRVWDMLERLSWSLKRRESLLNYYRKLDGH